MPLYPQISARNGRFAAGNAARNAGLVPPYGGVDLITALTHLGLSDNLRLCLDAGDSSSYSSGQSWLDRSGNGYDFFRGATSGATTDDPTFNGSAGAHTSSEYWSFDGGDTFTYDTTNETWMENLHKAGAKFSFLTWIYLDSVAASRGIAGNNASLATNIGFNWASSATGLAFAVANGSGSNALFKDSTVTFPALTWVCLGVSVNEAVGADGIQWFVNGPRDTDTSTYTSPSSSASSLVMRLGSRGGGGSAVLGNGSRMAIFAAWEGKALSRAEMTAVYQATRNRFGV